MIVLIRFLQRTNVFIFILLGLLLLITISASLSLLIMEDGGNINRLYSHGPIIMFIIGVLFAPFIETIIFQAIPYFFINKYFRHKKKLYLYLLISAIIFIHYNSLSYIIITFFGGAILALFYYVAIHRKENAILLISLIHGINNLIAFTLHNIN